MDAAFNVYKLTTAKISEDGLSKINFFVVDGNKKVYSALIEDEIERILKGNLAIVHDDSDVNGIVLVDKPQILLPTNVYDGFKDISSGEIIEGSFVTRNGYILISHITLNPNTCKLNTISSSQLALILSGLVNEHSIEFRDPDTGKIIKGLPFAPKIKKYYSFDYIRSAIQKSGSKITYILQQMHSSIIPTGAHEKIVSGYIAVESLKASLKNEAFIAPFKRNSPDVLYGKEFSEGKFLEIYDLLISTGEKYGKIITEALKYLDILNGISYGSHYSEFSPGPSMDDVNQAIKLLGFTEEELHALLWRIYTDAGSNEFKFRRIDNDGTDFTLKKWIKLISDKLLDYTTDDGSIYYEAGETLRNLLLDMGNYEELDTDPITGDIEKFTENEARYATKVFDLAKKIFGGFTIKCMFANMVHYYGSGGDYKVLMNQRINLVSSTSTPKGLFDTNFYEIGLIYAATGKEDVLIKKPYVHREAALFAAFLLDSHIYLPLEGSSIVIKESYNALKFDYGPLVAFAHEQQIFRRKYQSISSSIGINFEESFIKQKEGIDFVKEIIGSHKGLIRKLENKIILKTDTYFMDKFEDIELGKAKRKNFRDDLFDEVRRIAGGKFRQTIKNKIDTFLKNQLVEDKLYFDTIDPTTNIQFFVTISKQDLIDSKYNEWGQTKVNEINLVKKLIIESDSKNIAKYFSEIIRLLGDGTVRIFPLYKDDSGEYRAYERIRLTGFKYLPSKGYFDIDLSVDSSQYLLEYIGSLIFSNELAFAIQDWDGQSTIPDLKAHLENNNDYITILSRNGHFNIGELLSLTPGGVAKSYHLWRILIDNFEITPSQSIQKKWRNLFFPPFSIGDLQHSSIISDLMDDVRSENNPRYEAIRMALYGGI